MKHLLLLAALLFTGCVIPRKTYYSCPPDVKKAGKLNQKLYEPMTVFRSKNMKQ